jgi:hypothetical protein
MSAWFSAVIGLLGVVVGVLLSGLLQYALERQRERRIARAGARVLYGDLVRLSAIFSYPELAPKEMFAPDLDPEKTWKELRASVVGHLTTGEWDAVRLAWELVAHYSIDPDYVRKNFEDPDHYIGQGAEALRRLAGFPNE